jgi:hypothetical protein
MGRLLVVVTSAACYMELLLLNEKHWGRYRRRYTRDDRYMIEGTE